MPDPCDRQLIPRNLYDALARSAATLTAALEMGNRRQASRPLALKAQAILVGALMNMKPGPSIGPTPKETR